MAVFGHHHDVKVLLILKNHAGQETVTAEAFRTASSQVNWHAEKRYRSARSFKDGNAEKGEFDMSGTVIIRRLQRDR